MSIPVGCTRVVHYGALPGGEVWNTGHWMIGTGIDSNTSANAIAAQLTLAMTDSGAPWGTSGIQNINSAGVTYKGAKVYHYMTGGPAASFQGESINLTPPAGTAGAQTMPDQCAVCVSLLTEASGRQNRGRMYLPINSATLPASGQLGTGTNTQYVTALKVYLQKATFRIPGSSIVVMSNVGSHTTGVTRLRADTIVDTQRRRTNKLVPVGINVQNL